MKAHGPLLAHGSQLWNASHSFLLGPFLAFYETDKYFISFSTSLKASWEQDFCLNPFSVLHYVFGNILNALMNDQIISKVFLTFGSLIVWFF